MRGGWFPGDPPDAREIFERCMVVVVLISMLAALLFMHWMTVNP